MTYDSDDMRVSMDLIGRAVSNGKVFFSQENLEAEFKRACEHILQLTEGAIALYRNGNYGLVVFIALATIEEVTKTHISLYRRTPLIELPEKRKGDVLFDHSKKLQLALQNPMTISSATKDAIGEERLGKILSDARSGKFKELRESALYMDMVNGHFTTPSELFGQRDAHDLLLLAIDAWSDALVGYSAHTFHVDKKMMAIFDELRESLSSDTPIRAT